jgi:hypothetical protein
VEWLDHATGHPVYTDDKPSSQWGSFKKRESRVYEDGHSVGSGHPTPNYRRRSGEGRCSPALGSSTVLDTLPDHPDERTRAAEARGRAASTGKDAQCLVM